MVMKPINAQKYIKISHIINTVLQKMFRSLLCSSRRCVARDGHYKTLQTFVTQSTDVKYEVLNNMWLEIQQIKIQKTYIKNFAISTSVYKLYTLELNLQ